MAEGDVGAVAPVVNAPAADAVQAPDAPAVQEQADQQNADETVKPEKTFTEEEVRKTVNDRLTKERRRIERNVRLELENQSLKRQIEDRTPVAQPAGKPTPEQFAGKPYETYVEALAEWIADNKAESKLSKIREEMQAQEQERTSQARMAEAAKNLRKGAEKYPDFDEVVGNPDAPITAPMADAITRSGNSSDLSYYLCSNLEEAAAIAALPAVEQIWAIKELSAKLTAAAPTKTPAPIKPNAGSGSATTGYRKEMSDKQFAEWRARQRAQR